MRVPPEGVGDVLHHPLHQDCHLFASLSHVGCGRGGSGAPLGQRRAAGGSSAGSARARVCAGVAENPASAPAAENFRVSPRVARARGSPGLGWPGWSPTCSCFLASEKMLQILLRSYLRSLFYTFTFLVHPGLRAKRS